MKRILVACFVLLLLQANTALTAPGHLSAPTDNGLPYFLTVSVYPQAKGSYQVYIIPEFNNNKDYKELFLNPIISYGISDQWLVYATFIPYIIKWNEWVDRKSGWGDTSIGTEYSWMYINKSTFSASVLFNINIPTSDIEKDLTDGLIYYEPFLILAKDFIHTNYRVQFFSQIGFSIAQRLKRHTNHASDDPAAHYFNLYNGVALRFEKVNYSIEFNWFTNEWNNNGDDDEFYVTPGIYVQLSKDVAVGIGVPIGLNHDADRYRIIGNILVNIDAPNVESAKSNKKLSRQKQNLNGRRGNSLIPSSAFSGTS